MSNDGDPCGDDPSTVNLDDLQERMKQLDPHQEGAIVLQLSAMAMHVECCQGVVRLMMAPEVARELIAILTNDLAAEAMNAPPAGSQEWN